MGKMYPTDLPEVGGTLDAGNYLAAISKFSDDLPTKTGKYQIKVELTVQEPTDARGSKQFENFVIGTDEDPTADDPVTWKKSFAAGRYRQLFIAAGLELSGNSDTDWAKATGQIVGLVIKTEIQAKLNKDGSENPYAGREQSRVRQFFRRGEKVVGVIHAPTSAAPKPAPRPMTPVAQIEE